MQHKICSTFYLSLKKKKKKKLSSIIWESLTKHPLTIYTGGIFSPNGSPSKTMKMFLLHLKSFFWFSKY